ncbi:MAG: DUF1731 domain-containing protein [Chloroflexi bacterium]|nr:DUF1731 domain-containing protein [Chloroflexota bacterium]
MLEQAETSGAYNLCAPEPVQYQEFALILGEVLGRRSYLPVPAFAMRLLLGEAADLVLNGRRAHPDRLVKAGFTFKFPIRCRRCEICWGEKDAVYLVGG